MKENMLNGLLISQSSNFTLAANQKEVKSQYQLGVILMKEDMLNVISTKQFTILHSLQTKIIQKHNFHLDLYTMTKKKLHNILIKSFII